MCCLLVMFCCYAVQARPRYAARAWYISFFGPVQGLKAESGDEGSGKWALCVPWG